MDTDDRTLKYRVPRAAIGLGGALAAMMVLDRSAAPSRAWLEKPKVADPARKAKRKAQRRARKINRSKT
jgi:hypothetical protein